MTDDEITRFWAKVDRTGPVVRPELGNCWLWTASKRNGYGAFAINRKPQQTHRLSYKLEHGEVPPLLRHRCDNRGCVRPSHLEPGTYKSNAIDKVERNRFFTELTTEDVVKARQLARSGKSMAFIAKELGFPRAKLIGCITGKTFQHVIEEPPVALLDIYRPVFNKLTEEQYEEIIEALKKPFLGQGVLLARKYGVHPSLITLIKKQRLKTIEGAS